MHLIFSKQARHAFRLQLVGGFNCLYLTQIHQERMVSCWIEDPA